MADIGLHAATPAPPRPRPYAGGPTRLRRLAAAGGGLPVIVAASLAVATLSLLAPTVPSSDAWAWLVWGREIAEFGLDTTNGPSWKPLPALFTAPFALFGDLQPALWMITARTGGLLAAFFTYRLVTRLARPAVHLTLARLAGGAAALALLSTDWLGFIARGEAEPLVLALLLGAVDRHLDGHDGQALLLGWLAALGRPEVWPLLGLGWLWLWRSDPALRRWVVLSAAALVAAWVGFDWWGSGNPLLASERANRPTPSTLADAERPALAVIARAAALTIPPVLVAAVVAGAIALRRGDRVVLALAGAACGWVLVVAVMTEAGYTGNARYLFPVAGVICVLAGLALAWAMGLAGERRTGLAIGALIVATALPFAPARVSALVAEVRETRNQERARDDLSAALERAGGVEALSERGRPAVTRGGYQSVLAWEFGVSLGAVARPFPPRDVLELDPPSVVLDSARPRGRDLRRRPWLARPELSARTLATTGFWRVLEIERRPSATPTAAAPG